MPPICSRTVSSRERRVRFAPRRDHLPVSTESPVIEELERTEKGREHVLGGEGGSNGRTGSVDSLSRHSPSMSPQMENRRTQLLTDLEDAPAADQIDELQARVESQALATVCPAVRAYGEGSGSEGGGRTVSPRHSPTCPGRIWKQLTAAQLSVADLEPPVSESDDPIVQWKELSMARR